jgi:DNA-binding LytR/AlgR family response regulator
VKTVMVVDGDVLVRMPMCVRGIEHREAVKVLEDIRVDVVLSDIEVPGAMNGLPSRSGLAQPAPS